MGYNQIEYCHVCGKTIHVGNTLMRYLRRLTTWFARRCTKCGGWTCRQHLTYGECTNCINNNPN